MFTREVYYTLISTRARPKLLDEQVAKRLT